MSTWTVFSNHGHVLLFLARFPESRLRDVAEKVGITERAVQKIVKDLQDSQVISVHKHGRRNRYRINKRKPLQHELEAHKTIGSLVKLIDRDSRKKNREKVETEHPPLASAAPVAAEIKDQKTPPSVKQKPGASVFEDPDGYGQTDFVPDAELVPISAYDPFEETVADFEPEPEPEPEAPEFPIAGAPSPEKQAEPAVSLPADATAKDKLVKPPVKKAAKKTSKDKPPDEQQGSLF